jgi:lipopolysaccharide assembly outer membrane protein LptD (OstA)
MARSLIPTAPAHLLLKRVSCGLILGLSLASLCLASTAQASKRQTLRLTLTGDRQIQNPKTGDITAQGNASLSFPAAKLRVTAQQATYLPAKQKVILTGNAKLRQPGKQVHAKQITCTILNQRCTITQK